MHSRHLILTATGLLLLCCILIISRSGKDRENGRIKLANSNVIHKVNKTASSSIKSPGDVAATKIQPTRHVPRENNRTTQRPSVAKIGQPANLVKPRQADDSALVVSDNQVARKKQDGFAGEDAPRPNTTSSTSQPESVPKGIQLADNVKLPAVILAITAVKNDTGTKIPAPVAAAMRGIVDTFYRNLADSADPVGSGSSPEASSTEDTIVIHPGPAVEKARKRANETYRALFGDVAYDQMTMRALMEAQLPTGVVTGGN